METHFYLKPHQHKATALLRALRRAGYRQTYNIRKSKFVFLDHEWSGLFAGADDPPWRPQVLQAERACVPLFIYPHSVRPNIPHDLTDSYWPKTTALFTFAEGHKEVLRRIGYPHPIEITGWTYTDIQPFKNINPKKKIRVLFAPIHPYGTGFLPDIDRELNARTYEMLLELLGEIKLTVRHAQPLINNSLWEDTRVSYVNATLNGTTQDMEYNDVIIGAFTYAHMAVALGHPLVMMGEEVIPHNSPRRKGKLILARNWEKYHDYMRYPYNVEDCKNSADLLRLIQKALHRSGAVEDWKARFIGDSFDEEHFVSTVESYVAKNQIA